jgi:hypothetical protein
MTSFARKLALAAVLVAALPAAARARPCDDERPAPAVAYPAAPPAWRDGDRDGEHDGWGDRWREGDRDGWRDRWRAGWRERQLWELRGEFRALEDQRAAFYARWGWNGRKVARFERWYGERRAELQYRWDALQQYAWR